ncbi:MAG: ABC transporter ATP-binding protein [Planctomycetes bacterium]|nr:ABC transporter ATP-binding protein [Planctomycetota bacterium]
MTKCYGTVVGVLPISFSVMEGEIFGFLGPNGAGKTTTIRMLLDLLRPTGGKIFFQGKKVRKNSLAIRRNCGYLPGSFEAYGNMKGAEFLRFVAQMRGVAPRLPAKLLERFGLSQAELGRKIKHLSHGTQQKLGIVQAFFHEPELLILDEPTIGLDPLMQEEFYGLLRESQAAGVTIFFSSHNLPEVEKVCQRAAIVRAGELVAVETLEVLKKNCYRRMEVTLGREVEGFELKGAELIRKQNLNYEFLVKGEIKSIMQNLLEYPIEDVVFPEPDLEEVFMTYYRRGSDE